jgi:Trypsin
MIFAKAAPMRAIYPIVTLLFGLAFSSEASFAIVNGTPDTSLKTHMVMVLDDHGRMCSGAVLSQTAIVTAAHCVTNAGQWRVHWRGPQNEVMLVEPKAIRIHPAYDPNAVKNRSRSIDLAVITLSEPLPSSFEPLSLPEMTVLKPDDPLTVWGYGMRDEKNRKSDGTLTRADLTVVEPNGHSTILVWLSGPPNSGTGACHGDSGGPILSGNDLVALTSWTTGDGKSECGALTQGVLLAPHREWLMNAMKP